MKKIKTNGAKWRGLLAIAFIAVIGFSFVACSDDGGGGTGGGGGGGKSWKAVTNSPFDYMIEGVSMEYINTIAYGNGKFVAGGTGYFRGADNKLNIYGKIATSSDGITWTVQTNQPFHMDNSGYGISQIAYGNGKFVAVGGGPSGGKTSFHNKMAYSSDGITWIAVADTALDDKSGINVVYGNGKFVAFAKVGSSVGYRMAYSADGATWTSFTDSPNNPFKNNQFMSGAVGIDTIAYGNNKFYGWGIVTLSPSTYLSTSPDGVTWTELTETNLGNLYLSNATMEAIAYGNGKFVIGNYYGRMATSPDGVTWTIVDDSNNPFDSWPNRGNPIRTITYGNSRFVAGGDYGQMATSTDGIKWTADTGWADVTKDIIGASSINTIAYGNGKFVAGGDRSHMAYWD